MLYLYCGKEVKKDFINLFYGEERSKGKVCIPYIKESFKDLIKIVLENEGDVKNEKA